MNDVKTKNRIKLLVKLIVVIPIFYFIGFRFGMNIIEGGLLSILLFISFCIATGQILYRI